MKFLIPAALALFGATALAQSGHDSHHKMDQPAANAQKGAQTHRASGVVKSINADKGTVTIAHGPVESLKWPGMTMGFKAKDKKLLETLRPGQKIEFDFVQQGKDYVVTRVK